MRRATGPRPWQVHLFALVVIGLGLWTYLDQMWRAAQQSSWFRTDLPDDLSVWALVAVLSFQFLFWAIPAAIVWLFASRIAQWVVIGTSVWSLFWLIYDLIYYGHPAQDAVIVVLWSLPTGLAWVLLMTPAANRWFTANRKRHVAAFE